MLGFNQERGPVHADSGQSCVMFSNDSGDSWGEPMAVQPWTEHTGDWDCAFAQIGNGDLLMHYGFVLEGGSVRPPAASSLGWC